MAKFNNILEAVLRGASDQNINFGDLRHVLSQLGFQERIKGGHFIFSKEGMVEIINLQPIGSKAKAYPIRLNKCATLSSSISSLEKSHEQPL